MAAPAYIDETGNTGNNLFDPERPLFITAAFMTTSTFDLVEKASIAAIANTVNSTTATDVCPHCPVGGSPG